MQHTFFKRSFASLLAAALTIFVIAVATAQQPSQQQKQQKQQKQPIGVPVPPLGDGPFIFDTAEQHKIRVAVVTKGLEHPWSLAFLPDGNMLITERPGRLRFRWQVGAEYRLNRQVGCQLAQITPGAPVVGGPSPLLELLQGEAPLGVGVAERGHHGVPVTVGRADVVTGHGRALLSHWSSPSFMVTGALSL